MNDQDYWRQEQARADAARIKRAQGRDGTWVSLLNSNYRNNFDCRDVSGTVKKITVTNATI